MSKDASREKDQKTVKVIVTLKDVATEKNQDFWSTIRSLEAAGLVVQREMPDLGMVAGVVPAAKLEKLRRQPAVTSVDEDRHRRAG